MCSTYTSETSSLVCTLSGRLVRKMKRRQPHPGAQLTSDERQLSGTMFWRIFHICLCLGHRWTRTPLGCHQRFPRLSLSWSSMDADSTGMSSTFSMTSSSIASIVAQATLFFIKENDIFLNVIKNVVAVAAYVRLASWSQAKFQETNEMETLPCAGTCAYHSIRLSVAFILPRKMRKTFGHLLSCSMRQIVFDAKYIFVFVV